MRAIVVALLAVVAASGTAGCFTCHDQLDVHHCLAATGRCDTASKPTFDWDAQNLTALWPDVTRLLQTVEPGLHGHADWTSSQTDAFWAFYGIPVDQPAKELLLRYAGEVYDVRVEVC